ncbi:DUF2487 family protein [Paenibacillus sp. strain BS8-2]
MKFSDIEKEQWDELSPYLDTCLLPITGMTGSEKPYEATERLEALRDMLDLVEMPFKGRVVTYPACHYDLGDESMNGLAAIIERLKASGFKYVIVAAANNNLNLTACNADLILNPESSGERPDPSIVAQQVKALWSSASPA